MYIEPCCIQKQLPQLLKEEVSHFHSNSDWTVNELLLTLISCGQADELTIVMPTVNVGLLRTITFMLDHVEWIQHLTLITQGNERDEIKAQLMPYAQRVTVVEDTICFRSISMKSSNRYIVIQGSVNLEKSRSMQAFTVTTTEKLYNQFMETILPRIRVGSRAITL